jgi:hypothetical protein
MTRVDEINAQIAKLEAERESAMLAERANVLAKMKADINRLRAGKFQEYPLFRPLLIHREWQCAFLKARLFVLKGVLVISFS